MKTVLIFTLLGALLGGVAASLIVPPTLGWYNEAGFVGQNQAGQVQALVNIPQVIRYATTRLIKGQMIGAILGAAVFLVLGILASRRRRSNASAPPVAPPRS